MVSFKTFINEGSLGIKRLTRRLDSVAKTLQHFPPPEVLDVIRQEHGYYPDLPKLSTIPFRKKTEQYVRRFDKLKKQPLSRDNVDSMRSIVRNYNYMKDAISAVKGVRRDYNYREIERLKTPPEAN